MPDNTDRVSLTAAFIAGTAVGVAAALLTAPKRGKETRDDIKQALSGIADKVSTSLEEKTDNAKSKIENALDTTKIADNEGKKAAKDAKKRVKNKQEEGEEYR